MPEVQQSGKPKRYVSSWGGMFIEKERENYTPPGPIEEHTHRGDPTKKKRGYKLDGVIGYLSGMRVRVLSHQGKRFTILEIELHYPEGEEIWVVSLSYKSAEAKQWLYRINNLDPFLPIKITTYMFEDQEEAGRWVRVLGVYQSKDGGITDFSKVDALYTRENPNGLPPLEEYPDPDEPGKIKYSDKKAKDFIFEQYKQTIWPHLPDSRVNEKIVFTEGERVNNIDYDTVWREMREDAENQKISEHQPDPKDAEDPFDKPTSSHEGDDVDDLPF
jgi:hypothetical protein